jgi:hypothetical protein
VSIRKSKNGPNGQDFIPDLGGLPYRSDTEVDRGGRYYQRPIFWQIGRSGRSLNRQLLDRAAADGVKTYARALELNAAAFSSKFT